MENYQSIKPDLIPQHVEVDPLTPVESNNGSRSATMKKWGKYGLLVLVVVAVVAASSVAFMGNNSPPQEPMPPKNLPMLGANGGEELCNEELSRCSEDEQKCQESLSETSSALSSCQSNLNDCKSVDTTIEEPILVGHPDLAERFERYKHAIIHAFHEILLTLDHELLHTFHEHCNATHCDIHWITECYNWTEADYDNITVQHMMNKHWLKETFGDTDGDKDCHHTHWKEDVHDVWEDTAHWWNKEAVEDEKEDHEYGAGCFLDSCYRGAHFYGGFWWWHHKTESIHSFFDSIKDKFDSISHKLKNLTHEITHEVKNFTKNVVKPEIEDYAHDVVTGAHNETEYIKDEYKKYGKELSDEYDKYGKKLSDEYDKLKDEDVPKYEKKFSDEYDKYKEKISELNYSHILDKIHDEKPIAHFSWNFSAIVHHIHKAIHHSNFHLPSWLGESDVSMSDSNEDDLFSRWWWASEEKNLLLYMDDIRAYDLLVTAFHTEKYVREYDDYYVRRNTDFSRDYFALNLGLDASITKSYSGVATAAAILNSFHHKIPLPMDPAYAPHPYATQTNIFNACTEKNVTTVNSEYNGVMAPPGGLVLGQVKALLECNLPVHKAWTAVRHLDPSHITLQDMREEMKIALLDPRARLVVNLDRAALGQTGGGAFSPIGSYNKEYDAFLFMDVSKFEYPNVWIPASMLYQAMATIDPCGRYDFGEAHRKIAHHHDGHNMTDYLAALQALGCEPAYRGYIIVYVDDDDEEHK